MNLGWERDGLEKEMNLTCEPSLSVSQYVFPARNISIPVSQTGLGFDLDQNCKVQDINNRGLKFILPNLYKFRVKIDYFYSNGIK
jgi:hypothetical protein